jgi:hypothetical protein
MQEYPCPLCPNVLLQGTGDLGRLAVDAYQILATSPIPESPPSWELIFEMIGVTGAELKRTVYAWVALWVKLDREHEDAKKPENMKTITNPNV